MCRADRVGSSGSADATAQLLLFTCGFENKDDVLLYRVIPSPPSYERITSSLGAIRIETRMPDFLLILVTIRAMEEKNMQPWNMERGPYTALFQSYFIWKWCGKVGQHFLWQFCQPWIMEYRHVEGAKGGNWYTSYEIFHLVLRAVIFSSFSENEILVREEMDMLMLFVSITSSDLRIELILYDTDFLVVNKNDYFIFKSRFELTNAPRPQSRGELCSFRVQSDEQNDVWTHVNVQ